MLDNDPNDTNNTDKNNAAPAAQPDPVAQAGPTARPDPVAQPDPGAEPGPGAQPDPALEQPVKQLFSTRPSDLGHARELTVPGLPPPFERVLMVPAIESDEVLGCAVCLFRGSVTEENVRSAIVRGSASGRTSTAAGGAAAGSAEAMGRG